jgi:lysyl-tRNA synthetase, class II
MATLKDFRDERLRKLDELKKLGINPYPATSTRTHNTDDISKRFDELENTQVTIAGRIMSIRKFGKLAFVVVRDMSGQVQLFWRANDEYKPDFTQQQLGIDHIALLDTGDFVECTGTVIKTQTGEISVNVESFRLLTKTLRPMPSAQDGFTDKEQRQRRRYIDTNVNADVMQRYIRRSKFWQACREFLMKQDFVEVNIPVLEHTTGGADANPFVTHMDALDQDFYLRISHELPLKRLIGGGYEKVFDIGPRFRNENYSDEHLPEHIAMEWYWAYADWNMGMEQVEQMFRYVMERTFGTTSFSVRGFEVDFAQPWVKLDYAGVIKDHYDIDVFNCTIEQVQAKLVEHKLEVEKADNISRGIDKLWKKIRATTGGPSWLINTPLFISPLAKVNDDNPNTVQRFQAVIAGSELVNGYSELNDPIDQLNRFVEQEAMREGGDAEAQMLDIDYVEMLEYGMPPTCGFGISERVFWFFEGVTAREGVPFPQLRTEIDEVTKSIYPNIKFDNPHAAQSTSSAKSAKDLPISAAEFGTLKLYLDNYDMLECESKVVLVEDLGENSFRLILDQTCIYPGGGGQDFDLGEIIWEGGKLLLTEVTKDREGVVYHDGVLDGVLPATGINVHCTVNVERRLFNSRLHSAGHLLDLSVYESGYASWAPGKGAHYPHMSFVEYDGDFEPEKAEEYRSQIELKINEIITRGGGVTSSRVSPDEARKRSKYIPEPILKAYQNIHIATYNGSFDICCGGTHITDIAKIGKVSITKVKKKDGHIRVSYELA